MIKSLEKKDWMERFMEKDELSVLKEKCFSILDIARKDWFNINEIGEEAFLERIYTKIRRLFCNNVIGVIEHLVILEDTKDSL